MGSNHEIRITDIDVAMAIIAHEAVPCHCGTEHEELAQPNQLTSCTGGRFWGRPGETWPTSADGEPLVPWLQVASPVIRRLYRAFSGHRAVCFYIRGRPEGWVHDSVSDGGDFVVREYGPGEKLVPMARPPTLAAHPFHRVTWSRAVDFPDPSKYFGLFDEGLVLDMNPGTIRYKNHPGIKVGGWPTPLQRGQEYPGTHDLQIDVTRNYMYCDQGIGYLSRRDGRWHVEFETC